MSEVDVSLNDDGEVCVGGCVVLLLADDEKDLLLRLLADVLDYDVFPKPTADT